MKRHTIQKKIPNVFNFSGGRTSALMVIRYYQPGDIVLFTDTGREHYKTYQFIDDFERFEKIPVLRISYKGSKHAFKLMIESKKYKMIPNREKRFCTDFLKIKVAKYYLRHELKIQTFNNFIGFRYDEKNRVTNRKKMFVKVFDKFPLYEDKTTKEHVNYYWEQKPYNLDIPKILGNCDLCYLKGKNAIIRILSVYPELADKWIEDEEQSKILNNGAGRQYFKDTTYKELLNIAKSQLSLFKNTDLTTIEPAYTCECNNF